MQRLVCWYLRRRYGGDVHALKSPLGYRRDLTYPVVYKVRYWIQYRIWKAECALFERWGAPMRNAWQEAFR